MKKPHGQSGGNGQSVSLNVMSTTTQKVLGQDLAHVFPSKKNTVYPLTIAHLRQAIHSNFLLVSQTEYIQMHQYNNMCMDTLLFRT